MRRLVSRLFRRKIVAGTTLDTVNLHLVTGVILSNLERSRHDEWMRSIGISAIDDIQIFHGGESERVGRQCHANNKRMIPTCGTVQKWR